VLYQGPVPLAVCLTYVGLAVVFVKYSNSKVQKFKIQIKILCRYAEFARAQPSDNGFPKSGRSS
jgi:hypothetical protein